jgi:gliding motility-associated-like protein
MNIESQMFGNHETIREVSENQFMLVSQTRSFGFGSQDIYVIGFDGEGNSECNYQDISIIESDVFLEPENVLLPVTNFNPVITQPDIHVNTINIVDSLLCPQNASPIAGFYANITEACQGECIDFTDISANTPTAWDWTFEGGIPQYSTDQNPAQICYPDTGCFDVILIVSNFSGSDTLEFKNYICILPKPVINLEDSLIICNEGVYEINAPVGYVSYLWNDGSAGTSLLVNETGIYWVEVANEYGCISRDSVLIVFGYSSLVSIGQDTLLCEGDSIVLSANLDFVDYYWSNGSVDSSIAVDKPGIYWLEVSDIYGCISRDSIVIQQVNLPLLEIGNDTSFCGEFLYMIHAQDGFDHYLWQNGSIGQDFVATIPGLYWVVALKEGCQKSDTLLIVEKCPSDLWFPNCFTPNYDGRNDIFKPVYKNITGYKLYVFNRWGQQIFESSEIEHGWDGKFKGSECPNGVYFFLAEYMNGETMKTKEITGSVTLIR